MSGGGEYLPSICFKHNLILAHYYSHFFKYVNNLSEKFVFQLWNLPKISPSLSAPILSLSLSISRVLPFGSLPREKWLQQPLWCSHVARIQRLKTNHTRVDSMKIYSMTGLHVDPKIQFLVEDVSGAVECTVTWTTSTLRRRMPAKRTCRERNIGHLRPPMSSLTCAA